MFYHVIDRNRILAEAFFEIMVVFGGKRVMTAHSHLLYLSETRMTLLYFLILLCFSEARSMLDILILF